MLEHIKNNLDKQTFDKIEKMLKTEDGKILMDKIKSMDKEQLLRALNGKDLSGINYNYLNQALQNTDVKDILNKLNGGR